MNLRHLDAASDDAVAATARVETRYGKGDVFNAEFRRAVAAITANPRMYSPTEDGPAGVETREYHITRFDYRVIYAVLADEVVIVAVVHAARRPGLWVPRLDDLSTPEEQS